MLIQCTSCGKQAKIPETQEGAKVKCPGCAHVYVARSRTGRGKTGTKKEDPTKYFIIGGSVLAAMVIGIMAVKGSGQTAKPKKEEPVLENKPYVDQSAWDGPAATFARSLHMAAASGNESKLKSKLDAQAAYAYELMHPPIVTVKSAPPEAEAEAGAEGGAEAEATPAEPAPKPTWGQLTELQRIEYADGLIARVLLRGAEGNFVDWKPYDGEVVSYSEGNAVIHLKNQATDPSIEDGDRWTELRVYNSGGRDGAEDLWRWIYADRWYTEAELAAMNRGPRKARPKQKTLTDGSVVYESEVRTIDFDEGVPPEDRARLTKLVEDLISDINMRPKNRKVIEAELAQSGKNAIPALLSKMASVKADMAPGDDESEDDRIRLSMIHNLLEEITGYYDNTFVVSVAMGGTAERIESGIKQWYAWYDRKYKRFDEKKEAVDPLLGDPDIKPANDRERRIFEKARKEQAKKDKNGG